MKTKNLIYAVIAIVVLILLVTVILGGIGYYIGTRMMSNQAPVDTSIDSFEKCVSAGYPVMESYPRQCRANSQTFTEKISSNPGDNQNNSDYYGTSTLEACSIDTDCQALGCNGEICGAKNSDYGVSDCLFPSQPLPKDLGYMCKCVFKKCQWNK